MAQTMIEEGAAYGVTYGSLFLFAAVASLAARFVYKGSDGAELWYSARNSQGWFSLGLSFFASSMGAWVIFATPEVGALQGWWGVLGYATSSVVPFVALGVLGPLVRSQYPDGFCLTDWVQARFGRATQIYVCLISVFYMWVYLVAELTSMGNLIVSFAGLDPLHALIPVSLVTLFYTLVAGLPASIWTDRLQGVFMVIVICVAVGASLSDVTVAEHNWKQVSAFRSKGFEVFVTLVYALLGAELLNMGGWQRVYAAENVMQLRKGLAFGVTLIFPTMILFGVVGMLAEAQDRGRTESILVIKALAFFDLLRAQSQWVIVLSFALATCMVASSVDSLQTGIVSVLSHDVKKTLKPHLTMMVGQIFVLAVNIPAIALAHSATKDVELGLNIINLFLIADLLAVSVVVPIFAGLGSFATQNGALAGCMSGLLTILCFGWFEFGTFMAGLEMATLMAFGSVQPPEVGLSASRTCILFFVLPVITGCTTFGVSWMEQIYRKLAELAPTTPKARTADMEESKNLKAESGEVGIETRPEEAEI